MTPKQWENISDVNMAKAEEEKSKSASLKALVESLLEQMFADVQKQLQATANAFQMKVQELRLAKSQMEDQLAKVEAQKISESVTIAVTAESVSWLSLLDSARTVQPADDQR